MKNIFIRFLAIFLLFPLLLSIEVNASDTEADSVPSFVQDTAGAYFLMDADTGTVLSQKNSDLAMPMASTTKIMTCIIALENASLSDAVKITKQAVGVEGSSVYLVRDEVLTLEELLLALMLESANDAAVAIAIHVSQDVESFCDLMNRKAAELGMRNTRFANPHGLPCDGHYSTARDLSLLMAYCMNNQAFSYFVGTKSATISAPEGKKRFLSNHNRLLNLYEDCVGGKTGFTKVAGRCLVTAAEKNGKRLVCTTLSDSNDWQDHVSLFRYGFSLYHEMEIASAGSLQFSVPIVGGKKEAVSVTNCDDLFLPLRDSDSLECTVFLPSFVYADVKQGDSIGEALYTLNGKVLAKLPLVSLDHVEKRDDKLSFWQRIIQKIKLWLY